MNCQEFKQIIDSYIGDELLVETNHDVLRHLESCQACRRELTAHRHLRAKLRSAVKNASEMQLNSAFSAQLRFRLRETALRSKWWEINKSVIFVNNRMLLATAMGLFMVASLAVVWIKYKTPDSEKVLTAQSQTHNSNIVNQPTENLQVSPSPVVQIVRAAWREIADLAVGDHENCALVFKLKEKPITLEEASKKYGKFNKNLDKAVIEPLHEIFPEKAADGIKLLEAHSCVFNGRRFAHIVLRRQNKTISVLVTDANLSADAEEKITDWSNNNLQIASFHTSNYAVFVISEMTAQENLTVAQTFAASVRRHLEKSEI